MQSISLRGSFSCERSPEEIKPAAENKPTGSAQQHLSPPPTIDKADGDAGQVQQPGRQYETDAVQQRILPRRQFGPVGITMEESEAPDENRRDPERWPELGKHRGAEAHAGKRDGDLAARERHTNESEKSATRHDERERDGQKPDCRCAQLRTPEADGNHGDDVIEARDRMSESAEKPDRFAPHDVRE